MSVILKALKSIQKSKQKESGSLDISEAEDKGEGFFCKKEPVVQASKSFNLRDVIKYDPEKKRIYIMSAVLIVLALVGLAKWIFGGEEDVVPAPRAVAAPQAPVQVEPKPVVRVETKVSGTTQGSATNIIKQAINAFDAGDYNKSIRLYKQAVERNPGDAMIHNSLGLAYVRKGLYSSAASEYMTSLELDDKCVECYNNFGFLKSILGEEFEAKKYLERAINLSATYPAPYFNLAVLYEKGGDVGNAVKYYRLFLEYYSNKNDELVLKVLSRIRSLTGK